MKNASINSQNKQKDQIKKLLTIVIQCNCNTNMSQKRAGQHWSDAGGPRCEAGLADLVNRNLAYTTR